MNETKFKPGDKVRVKSDLIVGNEYSMEKNYASDSFTSGMLALLGKEVTIKGSGTCGYEVKEDLGGWNWTDEMLESIKFSKLKYIECTKPGQSYTTHYNASLYGCKNYDKNVSLTKGRIYKVIRYIEINTGDFGYSCSYGDKDYLIGEKGVKASTKKAYNAQFKPVVSEYYEYVGDSSDFTKGKIYKIINPDNLEAFGNFIDDKGRDNGYSGSNYKYFKPSTKEDYELQNKPKVKQVKEKPMKQFKVGDTVKVITPCPSSHNPKKYVGKITNILHNCYLQGFGECTGYQINDKWIEHSSGLELVTTKFKVGQWYKVLPQGFFGKFLGTDDYYEFMASELYVAGYSRSKDSKGYGFCNGYNWIEATNEEIQFFLPDGHSEKKPALPKFEVGKWYEWFQTNHNAKHYGKFNREEKGEYIVMKPWIVNQSSLSSEGTFSAQYITNVKEISAEEIQQYLPEGHVDKKFIFKKGEYYTSFTNGKLWQIFIYKATSKDGDNITTGDYLNTQVNVYFPTRHDTTLDTDGITTHKLSTPEEKQWLDACIKEGHYVSKEQALASKLGDTGTYIVIINSSVRSGTFSKGGVYRITSNNTNTKTNLGLAWINDDEDRRINLIQQYIDRGDLKWFATLSEAEAFSKGLLTPKITVESEMQRLGLAVGDSVTINHVMREPKGYYSIVRDVYEQLTPGWRDEVCIIRKGFLVKDVLYLELENESGGILATLLDKVTPKFKLGSYTVDVSTTKVKIGCTPLDRQKVVGFLTDFIAFSGAFDGDGEGDFIHINGVDIDYDTAESLLTYINKH